MTRLLPGDIVFTSAQGGGLISAGIRWATRTWLEPQTFASHVALVVGSAEGMDDVVLVEQTYPGIRTTTLARYKSTGFYVYRDRKLNKAERDKVVEKALTTFGPYGTGKIFLFLLDAMLGKLLSLPVVIAGLLLGKKWRGFEPIIFTQINLSGSLVCSQFVSKLWYDQGFSFGKPWYAATPDSMLDFCQINPERFTRIV